MRVLRKTPVGEANAVRGAFAQRRGRLLAACGAVCALALGQAPAPAQQETATSAGDAERGRRLFYEHGCYGCHGFNGQTGARDLVGTGSPIIADADAFVAYLRARADVAPLLPSTRMPSYAESALGDAEARDIFAYIQTFELDAPAVDSVPTLEAILDSAERGARER